MPFWDQLGEGRPRELHLLNYLTVAVLICDTVHTRACVCCMCASHVCMHSIY